MVVRLHEQHSVACACDVLGAAFAARAYGGKSARHRLDVRHAERLLDARHHVQVAAPGLRQRL